MDFPDGPGQDDSASAGGQPAVGLEAFIPLVFHPGLGWEPISRPQPAARAACLIVTAHIHLFRPDVPLRDLDVRAEDAVSALEEGAGSVTIIDDRHRVERVGSHPAERTFGGRHRG